MGSQLALRLPGRIHEHFAAEALRRLDAGEDVDLCDAVSRARVKRHGRGHVVFVPVEPDQVERLADWITDRHPKQLRDYRDAMRAAADQARGGD